MRANGRRIGLGLSAALALGLSACAFDAARFVEKHRDPNPTPALFSYCHGYGCRLKSSVSLTPEEWSRVRGALEPPAAGASEERDRVAVAVARFETVVGPKAGTAGDIACAAFTSSDPGQLDCVDETVNTTTLLAMLDREGLIRWHRLGPAAHRGYFIDRWPHNTAVLQERDGGRAFAVDSWFFANGEQPAIVPLQQWLDGWSPPDPEERAGSGN